MLCELSIAELAAKSRELYALSVAGSARELMVWLNENATTLADTRLLMDAASRQLVEVMRETRSGVSLTHLPAEFGRLIPHMSRLLEATVQVYLPQTVETNEDADTARQCVLDEILVLKRQDQGWLLLGMLLISGQLAKGVPVVAPATPTNTCGREHTADFPCVPCFAARQAARS